MRHLRFLHSIALTTALTLIPDSAIADVDQFGDPLPEGAIARLGTVRYRHTSGIVGLAYSKDGKQLATVGGQGFSVWNVTTIGLDGEMRSWNASDGKLLARRSMWEPGHFRWSYRFPRAVAYNPTGDRFLLRYSDSQVRLCDTKTSRVLRTFLKQEFESVNPFSPDGIHFVTTGDLRSVTVWHVDRADPVATIPPKKYDAGETRFDSRAASFLADGKRVIFLVDKFYEWRPFDKKVPRKMNLNLPELGPSEAAISGDRTVLATTEHDAVSFWGTDCGTTRGAYYCNENENVDSIALSHDGTLLAFTLDHRPEIIIRDIMAGKNVQTIKGADSLPGSLAFSKDSRRLISCHGDSTCLIWEIGRRRIGRLNCTLVVDVKAPNLARRQRGNERLGPFDSADPLSFQFLQIQGYSQKFAIQIAFAKADVALGHIEQRVRIADAGVGSRHEIGIGRFAVFLSRYAHHGQ